MRSLEHALRQGLVDLNLALDEVRVNHLLDYLELVQKWTRVYNLTAVRDPAEMLTHHLLDSLAVIAPMRRQLDAIRTQGVLAGLGGEATIQGVGHGSSTRLLDVGSGAGLPGVVVAICCPEVSVDCVDAVAKKAAFIQQVAVTLRLPNLRGVHARVESLVGPYEVICSRAFASLPDFVRWSSGALAGQGVWLAMKGKLPGDEIAGLPTGVEVFHVEQLLVPGLDAERRLVWMRKT